MSESVSGATHSEIAYAKINLALHVRKRLPNGYHELETIFAFLDQGDVLSVQPGDSLALTISGPFAEGLSETDNLVLQAAKALANNAHISHGAHLHLDKRLPVASGIGGGSADAAATLRLLNRFWGLDLSLDDLAELAKPLGADVPACVLSETSRGSGIGQDLLPVVDNDIRGCAALLVNPLVPVSTADIFAAWDGLDRGALEGDGLLSMARQGRNDLQKPAVALVPMLTDILQILEDQHPLLARMSGSGATCFALFATPEEARKAGQNCQQARNGLWTLIGQMR
ncbi:4-(cytidine 5'-diphospho)-2-C-methyl-D-erythritol kinase [Parasphingorhabdus sp.]|uniref:4-(cytidine 5'-diphospho)-2-C-methyl-D-erythritol kinase n=1 Tax=Parasphingorhabdus sp. TaxID=2709688 RepID=UPI003A957EB6